jgi:hypothetical protein
LRAASAVPYEKGALFARTLEEAVGRPRFDAFLREYIARFRFDALATEDFLDFAERELPAALASVDARAWLFAPGLPAGAPCPRSSSLEAIEQLARAGTPPSRQLAGGWGTAEWQLYLRALPRPAPIELLSTLDQRFGLTRSRNQVLLGAWLAVAAGANYAAALPRLEDLLGSVGRLTVVGPLFKALAEQPTTRQRAQELSERFAARYHPLTRQVVAQALADAARGPPAQPPDRTSSSRSIGSSI